MKIVEQRIKILIGAATCRNVYKWDFSNLSLGMKYVISSAATNIISAEIGRKNAKFTSSNIN